MLKVFALLILFALIFSSSVNCKENYLEFLSNETSNLAPTASIMLTSYYMWKGDAKVTFAVNYPESLKLLIKIDESNKKINVEFDSMSDKKAYSKVSLESNRVGTSEFKSLFKFNDNYIKCLNNCQIKFNSFS